MARLRSYVRLACEESLQKLDKKNLYRSSFSSTNSTCACKAKWTTTNLPQLITTTCSPRPEAIEWVASSSPNISPSPRPPPCTSTDTCHTNSSRPRNRGRWARGTWSSPCRGKWGGGATCPPRTRARQFRRRPWGTSPRNLPSTSLSWARSKEGEDLQSPRVRRRYEWFDGGEFVGGWTG